ncbi:AEC family transporter [Alkalithermobacter paradoxus]|uniref:Putative transporter YfdV n=1 Tax=Alkalithermobacter paradoxus TaxID=29349 RepID=A0A1V4I7Z8_9FIRM|nr:putative transporter YfdV [[Clostridium] thermoalcaliphilum]
MNFITIFSQILVLFSLILIGYIANKKGIITKDSNKDFSGLILNVTLPALIIKSMQYSFSREMFGKSMKILGISLLVYALAISFSFLITKMSKIEGKEKDVFQFLLIFPNVGFMGYPVINSIYGEIGVFYTSIFNMIFDLLIWTLGVMIMSRSSESKNNLKLKKIISTPGLIAVFIGYSLFLLSISLPKPIYDTLNLLGNATTPLAMIVVGSILAGSKMDMAFKNVKLTIISFIRLIFIPICVYFLLRNVLRLEGLLLGIPVIVFSMPSAANAAIFATRYDNDHILASQGVFLTTLFSVITIPLLIIMLQV